MAKTSDPLKVSVSAASRPANRCTVASFRDWDDGCQGQVFERCVHCNAYKEDQCLLSEEYIAEKVKNEMFNAYKMQAVYDMTATEARILVRKLVQEERARQTPALPAPKATRSEFTLTDVALLISLAAIAIYIWG